MVSNELSFMQEILANSIYPHDISTEFLIWIKYKHYPIVSLGGKAFQYKLSQDFNITSHNKWWIPIRLISNFFSCECIDHVMILWQKSSAFITETIPDHWTMLDIQQAGKYISGNYLYTLCNYFPVIEYPLLHSYSL